MAPGHRVSVNFSPYDDVCQIRGTDRKHVQQVAMMKARNGNMLTGANSALDRWKEYSKELMNEEIRVKDNVVARK